MKDKNTTSANEHSLKLAKRLTMVDIQRLAKHNEIYTLSIPAIEFIQLKEMAQIEQPLSAAFTFSLDMDNCIRIHLTAEANLILICQRCLQPYIYFCEIDTIFSPLSEIAATKSLPESYEPALLEDDHLSLISLLEEELILSLPLIPKHPDVTQCNVKDLMDDEQAASQSDTKSSNPFAVLKKLKKEE